MNFPSPDEIAGSVLTGEVKKCIASERGGWFLIWSEAGRFRADSELFATPPEIGNLVSFLPAEKKAGSLHRVAKIIFQPEDPPL